MRLLYVSPGPLEAKAVEGLETYAHTWPGEVTAVAPSVIAPYRGFNVVVAEPQEVARVVRSVDPHVVLALHREEFAWLSLEFPTVYTAEVPREIRTDLQLVSATNAMQRARIRVGQARREIVLRKMVRQAAGMQCNGFAAWQAYSHLNKNSMRFHDHRIFAEDLPLARERRYWDGSRPMRVAFSGRVTAIKGPQTVLEVARQLPDVEFEIIGHGDELPQLVAEAPTNVRFAGFMPFADWKAHVRTNVDVALLPHPQGDPSCTYHEFAGCGVPIVGLQNSTWKQLALKSGLGWAEKNADQLASRIASLRAADISRVAAHAIDTTVPYEAVAASRVAHLLGVAQAAIR